MKVLPQRNSNNPNYPALKDAVRTAATLALTTSTLVGVTSCRSDFGAVGNMNELPPTVETDELAYDGGMAEFAPGDSYTYTKEGKGIVSYTPNYVDGVLQVDLIDGNRLVVNQCDSESVVLYGISTSDIDDDSYLVSSFPKDKYEYFDSLNTEVYIIPKDCDYYIDTEEIELAGDVVDTNEPETVKYSIDSKGTEIFVDSYYYEEERKFELITGDCLSINSELFFIATDVTLEEIEEDSEFYSVFNKEDFVFYETSEKQVIIIDKLATSYYVDGLVIDGDVVAEEV